MTSPKIEYIQNIPFRYILFHTIIVQKPFCVLFKI